MPKVLLYGTTETLNICISKLNASSFETVKIHSLEMKFQLGQVKMQDIDAVFLVINYNQQREYLKNNAVKIKNNIADALKPVLPDTPVFIVLADSSPTERETFKNKFSCVKGVNQTTKDEFSLYQVGANAPCYVFDIFGYQHNDLTLDVNYLADNGNKILTTMKGKKRIIKQETRVKKGATSGDKIEEKQAAKQIKLTHEEKEDNYTDCELKTPPDLEYLYNKYHSKNKKPNTPPADLPSDNVIIIEQNPAAAQLNSKEAKKTSSHPPSKATVHHTPSSGTIVVTSGGEVYDPAPEPQISKAWEILEPLKQMIGTLVILVIMIGLFEFQSGLLGFAIAGTALASLTPLGLVLIGPVIIGLIVGIGAFCYFNRERLFGISQDDDRKEKSSNDDESEFELLDLGITDINNYSPIISAHSSDDESELENNEPFQTPQEPMQRVASPRKGNITLTLPHQNTRLTLGKVI